MQKLKEVIAYICSHYPNPSDLSKARLAKMIYLADWRSALDHGEQISEIVWEYNYYGPYVDDIINTVKSNHEFGINPTFNLFGETKEIISLRKPIKIKLLSQEEKNTLDLVIKVTSKKSWDQFIKLVYSTYPILTNSKFSKLNLVELAKRYKEEKKLFE